MRAARILLVEDENIVARDICSRLGTFGYDVIPPVATGEEALAHARVHRPDLVLMDIMLRGPMDGIEAAQQLRRELDIPVVYLTAYVDDKNLQRAKVTEPFGYLLKPFEERELHITIEIALYKHRIEQQLRESNAFNELLIQTIPFGMDIVDEEGRILFVSDNFRKQFQISGKDKRCWEVYRADGTQCENCPLQSRGHFDQGAEIEVPGIIGDRIFQITHTRLTYNGKPAILEIFQDITARKRAEKALHLSEERFAKALRTSPDAISINRIADGKYVEVNGAFSEQTGFAREDVVGRSVGSLGIWADPNDRAAFLEKIRLHGEAKNVEVRFRVK
ncbi:MAG TPA: response regulator, partial [Bacteroidota bacterium]|nr:response regulator [Bacteroidota bacterium]